MYVLRRRGFYVSIRRIVTEGKTAEVQTGDKPQQSIKGATISPTTTWYHGNPGTRCASFGNNMKRVFTCITVQNTMETPNKAT